MANVLKIIVFSLIISVFLFGQYVAVSNWSFGGWHDTEAWRQFSAIPLYGSGRWFGPIQRVLLQPSLLYLDKAELPGSRGLTGFLLFTAESKPDIRRFHVLFTVFNSYIWFTTAVICLYILRRRRRGFTGRVPHEMA